MRVFVRWRLRTLSEEHVSSHFNQIFSNNAGLTSIDLEMAAK